MAVNFDFIDGPSPLTPDPLAFTSYVSPVKDQVEHHLAKRLEEGFLAAVVAAKALDWLSLGKDWVDNGFDTRTFHALISKSFTTVFEEVAAGILIEAAFHGGSTTQGEFTAPVQVDTRVITPWGQIYSNATAARLALGSEAAIKDVVNEGLNARLPASALSDRARQTYGLDQRSGKSYRSYLGAKTSSTGQSHLEMLSKLLIQRSRVMGDNEVFAALNFGRQLTYMDAQARGILPMDAKKTWVTALDERVCPICKPMDGVSVPLLDTFNVMMPIPKTHRGLNRKSVAHIVPPVHPLCRCTIVPTERFEHGIITRTARFDDQFLTHHRGRLFSNPGDVILQH